MATTELCWEKRTIAYRGKSYRCVKLSSIILLSLLLTNVLVGAGLGGTFSWNYVQSIRYFLRPRNIFSSSQGNTAHKQCTQLASSFNDPLNKSLIADASVDSDIEDHLSNIDDVLNGRLKSLWSRRRHRFTRFPMKGKYRRAVELLATNLRKKYDPTIIPNLLKAIKKLIDQHDKTLNPSRESTTPSARFGTCAVIGNSGQLLNATRGAFINSHDAVIRINNAKPKTSEVALEDHVGSKTTLSFMNSHVMHKCARNTKCLCNPYGNTVPTVLYLCSMEHILDVVYCGGHHQSPIFVTDRRFDHLVARIARWYSLKNYFKEERASSRSRHWWMLKNWEARHKNQHHYSTGLQAVMLALGICEEVNLFGFGKDPKFAHHFHSRQKVENVGHDYEAEYLFYRDLELGNLGANPFLCLTGLQVPPVRVYH